MGGTLLRLSDRAALLLRSTVEDAVRAATGSDGSTAAQRAALSLAKADAVAEVVRTQLQPHLANRPDVQAAMGIVQNLRGQAETLANRLAGFEASLERLARFPNSLIREEERRDFEAFMAACRTGTEPPASEGLTTACLAGWQAQVAADRDDFWDTLARQVPPGILLLFLLATLGGLYRYNMRLSGFHHSRADALELLSVGRSPDDAPLSEADLREFVQMADALAADKVEFGRGNAPSDQAVEIAKSVVSRSG